MASTRLKTFDNDFGEGEEKSVSPPAHKTAPVSAAAAGFGSACGWRPLQHLLCPC